jgi:WXG100 family type VII secretion target
MLKGLFKILYDQTSQVTKTFRQQQSEIAQMTQKLKAAHQQLEGKDWVGVGAKQFNQDMNEKLMPALNRLASAMQEGADSIVKAENIMKKADDDQKNLWSKVVAIAMFKW